jgi:predicted GNAT family acetyltransferase
VQIDVVRVPQGNRYEAWAGGELLGVLDYRLSPGEIDMRRVEVRPQSREQGVAGQLTGFAVAQARADGLRVVPTCPFVRDWLAANPE